MRVCRSSLLAAAVAVVLNPGISRAANLPVPCATAACGATGPNGWVSSGAATGTQTGNQLTVNQTSNQAILNWSSFNIAAGSTVKFNQPATSAIALNRIFQNNPSTIFGNLTANGQIYLVNQNGIVFGPHSQVNTNSLIASTLNISDSTFTGGILQTQLLATNNPAFASDGRTVALDQNGNPVLDANGQTIPVAVVVDAGAQISTPAAGGGRIALFGQRVENSGTLSSPGGQVILAAGQKVYLQASDDPTLRGLVVEVDGGGPVSNLADGQISSTTGNVTLLGLAVNQSGRISATSSVSANGSIMLLAQDTHVTSYTGDTYVLGATNTGTVELGSASVTTVLPDPTSTATAVDAQVQNPSTVQIVGHQIHMAGGAGIVATGGQVSLQATPDPNADAVGSQIGVDPQSQIRIDAGATIDVSGSNVTLPMSANIVSAQLRGNELRNDPQQKNGVLEGQTVYVDTRAAGGLGTTLADVSGEIAGIERTVQQRTTAGGSITVLSDGDAVLAKGATLNVSGGSVTYEGGVIATTQLVEANGQVVDISNASPDVTYTAVINPTVSTLNSKWGVISSFSTFSSDAYYEPGYVQGADAGTVTFGGRSLIVNGTLLGAAVAGPLQRSTTTASSSAGAYQQAALTAPQGGQLIIGNPIGGGSDNFAPSVDFSSQPAGVVVALGTPVVGLLDTLQLPTQYLTSGGFTRTTVYSDGQILVPSGLPLALAPYSVFDLTAPRIDLLSSVTTPGGTISLSAAPVSSSVLAFGGRGGIDIGSGVQLDVSGVWTNDAPELVGANPTSPTVVNGGNVSITMAVQGGALSIGSGVNIDVSAGAWATASGALTYGSAGSIVLAAAGDASAVQIGAGLGLEGYGIDGSAGGSLSITANRVQIVSGSQALPAQSVDFAQSTALALNLSDSLFSQGGFEKYTITANGPIGTTAGSNTGVTASPSVVAPLVIDAAVDIDNHVATRMLSDEALLADATGAPIASFTTLGVPLPYLRLPVSLNFNVTDSTASVTEPALAGDLVVEPGAVISGDPKSSFSFSAPTNIRMGGDLTAPGGTISLLLNNPPAPIDAGYVPAQGIYLESGSALNVSGTTVLTPSALGFSIGTVLPGGTVSIVADRGSVFAQAGSTIDVSGSSAALDIATGTTQTLETIASAGGSLTIVAPESIELAGSMSAQSGAVPGTPGPAGGSLSITLSRNEGFAPSPPDASVPAFPSTPRTLYVGAGASSETSSVSVVNPVGIATAGFSSVTLAADDVIELPGGTTLKADQSLALAAPTIVGVGAGTVTLQAPTVNLGPTNVATQSANCPTADSCSFAGSTALSVQAGVIGLNGNLTLQGFGQSTLTAANDLQAIGVLSGQALVGSLTAAGALTLTAREIYPTTLSQFTISVPGGSITTASTGVPEPVLSAGGALTLNAADINHDGAIEVPFGTVAFNATQNLSLGAGSIVSVSGQGQTIPFGETQNGTVWVYDLTPTQALASSQVITISAPPAKQVALSGPSVNVASGATINVSGGGELYAYEFVAGLGGSNDALSPSVSPNTYAILPSLRTAAPLDAQYSGGTKLQPGAAVYLSGVPGELAAGTYTLLPARYALLPGAFLITLEAGQQDLQPGQIATAANGAPIVSGYFTTAGTTLRDSRTSGFEIEPGSYAHQLAEYDNTYADTFFPAQAATQGTAVPQLPVDAGALVFSVGNSLVLDGSIDTTPATGGRGATVDVSANNLEIVSQPSAGSNAVQITAGSLEALGAQSLLLGGTRSTLSDSAASTTSDGGTSTASAGGTLVTVDAQTVTVAPGTTLSAPEILLTAQDSVSIGAGAQLTATGTSSVLGGGTLTLASSSGSSALVRVSAGAQVDLSNKQVSNPAAGSVFTGAGSVVSAQGSITVGATQNTESQGTFDANHGSLSLEASQLSLGNGVPATTPGLVIGEAQLSLFDNLSDLRLISLSTIDVYGGVSLGSLNAAGLASLGSLVLDAAAIRGFGPAGDAAQMTAGAVRLTDSEARGGATSGTGAGTLQISGTSLELDAGSYGFSGFQNVTLASRGDLIANGSVAIAAQGGLTLQGSRILGNSGTQLTIDDAGYAFQTIPVKVDPTLTAAPGLGVIVSVDAASISHGGAFVLPSGQLTLDATGDISLASGSSIDVAGSTQTLGGVAVQAPGGSVLLQSTQGNVTVANGARLDVSASAGGGNAGTLEVDAAGTAQFAGTLTAQAQGAGRGGSVILNVGQIGDFVGLTSILNTAGFTQQQDITVQTGNVTLAAGSQIIAQNVGLTVNGGSLTINGTIDARGANGGNVELAASGAVLLGASGSIRVDASGAGATGGNVELDTSQGTIATATGSLISAAGAGGGGSVVFRAPAVGNDVAITALDGSVTGAADIVARVVQTYTDVSTVDAGLEATIANNLANFATTAGVAAQRLGQSANPGFMVEAAVEITSPGNMMVSDPWDLSTLRPNGLPGELALRAGGTLTIGANLSDGLLPGSATLQPLSGPSWSYRLTGGADLGSANPGAVQSLANLAVGTGDVIIGSGAAVRTGTGSIRVDAGEDVAFQDPTAVLYTTGVAVASMLPVAGGGGTLNWVTGGGNISIAAGRDVVGAVGGSPGALAEQIVTPWQLRTTGSSGGDKMTFWGIDFDTFQENVAALGGGNVDVTAGRDVLNFSAAIPTSGSADQTTGVVQTWGGGNLNVVAGRDLTSGVYYVGNGVGNLSAGRSLVATDTVNGDPFGTVLALGTGTFNVTAGNTLQLETVLNPTVIGQPVSTRSTADVYFFTYNDNSAVNLTALSGAVSLLTNDGDFLSVVGPEIGKNTPLANNPGADAWYPGRVSAVALGGDVDVGGTFLLYPSAVGQLNLLASGNVNMTAANGSSVSIVESDVEPALVPSAAAPGNRATGVADNLSNDQFLPSSLHNADSTPAEIVALAGDVNGGTLTLDQPARVIAGLDILDTRLQAENYQPGDVTLLQAGRDINYDTANSTVDEQITIGGPGYLDVLAGRNIDLGATQGITTVGATVNSDLPGTTGASIELFAGLGKQPAFQAFITQYLVDATTYSSQVTGYMQSLTGNSTLSAAAALTDFESLSTDQQIPLISTVFFNELNQAGLEATAGQKPGYTRGFDAINTLFPGSLTNGTTTPAVDLPYSGNLALEFSQIYTLAGGDINLFVPGGSINVGVANPPVNAPDKSPSQLGIVAQETGSVDAFTYGDVLVNQSRIFTLDGGNIVIWSSTGNIDAGRGAKTAISAPPPTLIVNPDGTVSINFQGAVTGSGIRTILTEPGVVPGNVDLIAPVGIVNASDAGIGSAGNLNIAAATVLGANNINVGGTASGVPSPTFSLAAGLTGVSNATAANTNTAVDSVATSANEKTASVADSALNWLDVFVTGLGEENCKPEDIECLRRQKKN